MFWVVEILQWKRVIFIRNETVLDTPLWYNNKVKLQIKRYWLKKGIHTVWDVIEITRVRIEYCSDSTTVREYLRKYEMPSHYATQFYPIMPL